jgi:hypothetical protein
MKLQNGFLHADYFYERLRPFVEKIVKGRTWIYEAPE